MNTIHKVNAAAGVQWLLGGLALLRRAPVAVAGLGMLWGSSVWLLSLLAVLVPVLHMPLQMVLLLLGPTCMGGLFYALREVECGRLAKPSHLLQGLYAGRLQHLLVALLPQALAGMALYALLYLLIGETGLQQIAAVLSKLEEISRLGVEPDPAQIQSLLTALPAGRIALWLLSALFVIAVAGIVVMLMLPQVMFESVSGLQALWRSIQACAQNGVPILIFGLLIGIVVTIIYTAAVILLTILAAVIGQALALIIVQLLLTAVMIPVLTAAMYIAWQQLLGRRSTIPPPLSPQNNHVFEA